MTDIDFRKLYEELRLGSPCGSRHALAVFLRSGVAAWMRLLSNRGGRDTAHRGRTLVQDSAPADGHEIVQVLTAMVIGRLQGVNP